MEHFSNKQGDSFVFDIFGDYKVSFEASYVLGEKIREGHFGVVYKTHHRSNDKKTLAVKVIPRDIQEVEDDTLHEVQMLHQSRHIPNVIQLIDFFMDNGKIYIIQSLAEGGDVFDRLEKRTTYEEKDVQKLAKILLDTIAHIHQHNVVHRDLKPENLLLKDEANDYEITLCDFGMAKQLPDDEARGLRSFAGTPAYMAPEIISNYRYREKVDMWSIGCILYVLLCGNMPFGQEEDENLFENILEADYDFEDENWDFVSGSAKSIIVKLLQPNSKKRWSAVRALESNWFKKGYSRLSKTHAGKSHVENKNSRIRRRLRAACHAVRFSNLLMFSAAGSKELSSDFGNSQTPPLAGLLSESTNGSNVFETRITSSSKSTSKDNSNIPRSYNSTTRKLHQAMEHDCAALSIIKSKTKAPLSAEYQKSTHAYWNASNAKDLAEDVNICSNFSQQSYFPKDFNLSDSTMDSTDISEMETLEIFQLEDF